MYGSSTSFQYYYHYDDDNYNDHNYNNNNYYYYSSSVICQPYIKTYLETYPSSFYFEPDISSYWF
jgi:hypothetical protein